MPRHREITDSLRRIIRKQLGLETLRSEWVPLTQQTRLAAVQARKVDIECRQRDEALKVQSRKGYYALAPED